MLSQGEGIATKQSQEVAEVREEFATLKESEGPSRIFFREAVPNICDTGMCAAESRCNRDCPRWDGAPVEVPNSLCPEQSSRRWQDFAQVAEAFDQI